MRFPHQAKSIAMKKKEKRERETKNKERSKKRLSSQIEREKV